MRHLLERKVSRENLRMDRSPLNRLRWVANEVACQGVPGMFLHDRLAWLAKNCHTGATWILL